MKIGVVSLVVSVVMLAGVAVSAAADLRDKVEVAVESQAIDPAMQPGTYVCAAGHLHIKALVTNLADMDLGRVTVAGKVFDADGKLLGTATSTTKATTLRPGEKTEVNLEFRSVTGPMIHQVTRRELTVVAAQPKD